MVVWNRTGSAIPSQQLKNWLYLYPHVEVTPNLIYHQRREHSCIEVSQLLNVHILRFGFIVIICRYLLQTSDFLQMPKPGR